MLENIVITNVFSSNDFFTPENVKKRRFNRERWAIIIKYEGETVYRLGSQTFRSDLHIPIILPKGISYEWECIKAGRCFAVEFDAEQTADTIFDFKLKRTENLLEIMRKIEHLRLVKPQHYEMECIKYTYELILLLLKSSPYYSSRDLKKISAALDCIASRYFEKLSVSYLASVSEMSEVYFRKLFKKATGYSPTDYINKLRIDKAKELLSSDFDSIASIAFNVGFNDVYYFSKTFKRYTGITPSEYKRRVSAS